MKTIVGVDENGLGPVLGPMTSTALTLEVARYQPMRLAEIGLSQGVTDSKATSAFGKMSFAESLALATIEATEGSVPRNFDELLSALSLDGLLALRAPCPSKSQAQCWSNDITLPHFGGTLEQGRAVIAALAKKKVHVRRVRTVVSCAGVLNAQLDQGRNKLIVNLGAFERLILDARRTSSENITAYCGIIGGLRSYTERFTHFPQGSVTHAEEVKGVSAYSIRDVGDVRFEVDADAGHLPVAWASLVGKYVRELSMARLNAFYTEKQCETVAVSGYHDPVTKRFVASSEPLRKRLGIVDTCFARTK